MGTLHFKTCRRYNIPGHAHYLTFSCFHRQPFLAKDRCRQWFIHAITRAKELHDFHLLAWVAMPEHAHLLIWPRQNPYSISAILNSIKKPVTNAALLYVRRHAPYFAPHMLQSHADGTTSYHFWQAGGGYDRNTFTADEAWEKIDYIHRNPVRRGLVATPQAWYWSSARTTSPCAPHRSSPSISQAYPSAERKSHRGCHGQWGTAPNWP